MVQWSVSSLIVKKPWIRQQLQQNVWALWARKLVPQVCYSLRISVQALNVDVFKRSRACNFVYQMSVARWYNRSLLTFCRQLPRIPLPLPLPSLPQEMRYDLNMNWLSIAPWLMSSPRWHSWVPKSRQSLIECSEMTHFSGLIHDENKQCAINSEFISQKEIPEWPRSNDHVFNIVKRFFLIVLLIRITLRFALRKHSQKLKFKSMISSALRSKTFLSFFFFFVAVFTIFLKFWLFGLIKTRILSFLQGIGVYVPLWDFVQMFWRILQSGVYRFLLS
jgi:hypothetical protein